LFKWLPIIILTLILLSSTQAQVNRIKIASIVVEGNKTAEASSIRLNSGLMVGQEIGGEDIQSAVKNLWALGIFSDIQILVSNQTSAGLDLIIRVAEYPRLRKVDIKGNDELDKDDIEKEIAVYKGMKVSDYKLYKVRQAIEKMYSKKGYLLATVNVDTISADPGFVDLRIEISEGKEVQIEKIRFHGNAVLEEGDLRGAMEETKEDRWWRSADFDEKKYTADLEKVLEYCRENGYRDAEILRDSISYSPDKQDMFIDIWVYEGEKYYFGTIDFTGSTIFTKEELAFSLDIKKGDSYDQKKYNKGITERLQKMYYDQGYLFAQIQPLENPVGKDTLDVNFNITEGNVVTINEINIIGNTKTNEKVIRREFKLQPGDIFNSGRLERSIRDITILNYFSNAIPNVLLIENDNTKVNLEVKVEEKSTDMANMSAGYSQRDGFIGSLGLAFNNFSIAHPFTSGDGQRLSLDWQFGLIYRSVSVSFTEPWLFNTPTLGGFSVYNTRTGGGYYPWDRRDIGVSLHIGRRFYWPDNYFRGDWIVRYSKSSISNISDPELLRLYMGEGGFRNVRQISLTQIFSRDSRDQPEFPTRGSIHSLSVQLSGGPLGGDSDYLKSILSLEWFIPMPLGFVLYSKNMYGVLEKLRTPTSILYGEYFYLGGSGLSFAEGLRGYDDGQVGPVTSNGSPIGGRSMVKNTLELRFPISPNPTIFGLLFAEAGNAWEFTWETDPFNLRRSAGIGIRLFMPMVGIIGIDFGYGFDYLNVYGQRTGKWKVHFQFGKF
jgi:outer membrane protein insertion porin family